VKQDKPVDWRQVENSPVRCADAEAEKAMMAAIDEAKAEGDTLGGAFELIATGVPVGLGSHVQWNRRLNGQIAQAIMSINAVKGVEIGAGFSLGNMKGSQAQDIIEPSSEGTPFPWRRVTNQAGGIEGGISNGQPVVVRAAVKPIATLGKPLPSVDLRTGRKTEAHYERSDICIVPAAGVVGEAMLAIVLTNAMLEKFGGDHLKETLANYHNYIGSVSS
jgi:chorismate synthase